MACKQHVRGAVGFFGALLSVGPAKADPPPPLFVVPTEAVLSNGDQGKSPTLRCTRATRRSSVVAPSAQ